MLSSFTCSHGHRHYCWQTEEKLKREKALSWSEAYYQAVTTINSCVEYAVHPVPFNSSISERYHMQAWYIVFINHPYSSSQAPQQTDAVSCTHCDSCPHIPNPALTQGYDCKWVLPSPLCEFRIFIIFFVELPYEWKR